MTRPYHALRHGDFRRVWISQLVSQVGSQMQSVALHWHIYLLTGSPLALGAVGLTRALPTVLFSLWGGVLADRRDRRLVMLAAQSGMTVVALALFGLTLSGRETLPALYLLNALGAAAGAFDIPARQALIPRLVPPANMMFFIGGPLGEIEAGLVASLFASAATGVTVSIVFGGLMTVAAAAVVALAALVIRDYRSAVASER